MGRIYKCLCMTLLKQWPESLCWCHRTISEMSLLNGRQYFRRVASVNNSKGCGCDYEWMCHAFPFGWFLEKGFQIWVWRLAEEIVNVCVTILSIPMGFVCNWNYIWKLFIGVLQFHSSNLFWCYLIIYKHDMCILGL